MTRKELLLATRKDIEWHKKKWEKEVYRFIYHSRHTKYQVDLLYYPETNEFYELHNPTNDLYLYPENYVTVLSIDNEYTDYRYCGGVREAVLWEKKNVHIRIYDLIDEINHEIRKEERWN